MYRRFSLAILLAAGCVGSLNLRAQRAADVEGQPTQLREGALESYWIWHDYDGYHLRTTTQHDRHAFKGRIEFSREQAWVKPYQLRAEDFVRFTSQGIEFHLATERNLNGFDFRLDYGNQATVHLEIDDRKGPGVLEHVFVGRENTHPLSNPFTISP